MTQNVISLTPPPGLDIRQFLEWWNEQTNLDNFQVLEIDVTSLPSELREAASAVVRASGHRLREECSVSTNDKDHDLVIFSETIFADVETRWDKLRAFLDYYRLSLESISAQREVYGARHVHFTYVSVDKIREILVLARLINRLNRLSVFSEMRLVLFEHPADSREAENGHIEHKYTPSRFGDSPKRLFRKAILNLGAEDITARDLYLRCALDDDDIWLPWAMQEMAFAARAVVGKGGRPRKSLGFPNQFLYYPQELGRVDSVRMAMVMTGSKVHVGIGWDNIADRHAWGLPESFSANMQRRFRHIDTDLVLAENNRPMWVYVRRAGRLSATTKFEHYREEPRTVSHIGDEHSIIEAATVLDSGFERTPLVFGIDPPALEARAEMGADRLLHVRVNLKEMIEAFDLDPQNLQITVNWGDDDGRHELTVPPGSEFQLNSDGWTKRTRLSLDDLNGGAHFSTWVRGKEIFLS